MRLDVPQPVTSSSSVGFLVLLVFLSILSISVTYQGQLSTILGIVVSVLAIYAVTKGPHMAVVCCLLFFLFPEAATVNSSFLFHLSAIVCAGLVVLAYIIHFGLKKRLSTGFWEPAAIITIMMLGGLVNPNEYQWGSGVVLIVVLAVIGIGTIRGKSQIRDVALVLWFSGVVISIVSLLDSTYGFSIVSIGSPMFFADKDPNIFGFFPGLSLACALGILCDPTLRLRWWIKLLMAGSIVLIIASLSIQGSRGTAIGIAASFIACFFLLMRNLPRHRRSLRTLFVFIAVVAIVLWLILDTPFGTVWSERFFGSQSMTFATGGGRIPIWEAGLRLYPQLPVFQQIFGTGFGSSVQLLGNAMFIPGGVATHNTFLDFLLEGGLIGLLLFLVFMVRVIFRCLFRACMAPELSLILLVYCVTAGFFIGDDRLIVFWCAICLIVAGVLPREEDKGLSEIEPGKRVRTSVLPTDRMMMKDRM